MNIQGHIYGKEDMNDMLDCKKQDVKKRQTVIVTSSKDTDEH